MGVGVGAVDEEEDVGVGVEEVEAGFEVVLLVVGLGG